MNFRLAAIFSATIMAMLFMPPLACAQDASVAVPLTGQSDGEIAAPIIMPVPDGEAATAGPSGAHAIGRPACPLPPAAGCGPDDPPQNRARLKCPPMPSVPPGCSSQPVPRYVTDRSAAFPATGRGFTAPDPYDDPEDIND